MLKPNSVLIGIALGAILAVVLLQAILLGVATRNMYYIVLGPAVMILFWILDRMENRRLERLSKSAPHDTYDVQQLAGLRR